MARKVLGVIAGYIVMALLVFVFLTGAYLGLGVDSAFKPGTYEVSMLWVIISCVVGLVAAIIGGLVCAAITRSKRAVQVLAGIVFVLGILVAIPAFTTADRRPLNRPASVPNLQAMRNARTPNWVALLNPFIGAAGVLIGSRLKKTTS